MIATVEHILGSEGPVAGALSPGYEPRPEQLRMAAAVLRAMEAKSHLLVEAGTGVGKSFAYLVPAMLRCMAGERVVVSTHTISLQEQLVHRDIPLLTAALEAVTAETAPPGGKPPVKIDAVLVKGRGNYVSIRRLELASARQDRLFGDAASRNTLHTIEDWALQTLDGTLSTLPQLEKPAVWDRVQSDSGNCMGRGCPRYDRCFYQRDRRRMERGNLLVCNHALFFSDMALRAGEHGFLPEYHHVVLDEAHNVEDVACEHFGVSLTEGRVIHLLSLLHQSRSGKGYLAQLAQIHSDRAAVERAMVLVAEAEEASRVFFENLLPHEGRVRHPGVVDNPLTPAMRSLALRMRSIKDTIRNEPDKFELNAYIERAEDVAAAAATLVEQSLDGCAYWVETTGGEGRRGVRVSLACSPIDVAPILKERLFGGQFSVVLTSATLATGGRAGAKAERPATGRRIVPDDIEASAAEEPTPARSGTGPFGHAITRLGCDGADTLLLGSPFDYASQVELHIDLAVPSPKAAPAGRGRSASGPDSVSDRHTTSDAPRPDGYAGELAERILHHLDATDGGAFILFTSFASLNAVARALRDPLARRRMPMFAQGSDGSRTAILEEFRKDQRSVLLGAASFWQGVDVRGRGLRNVIITRLPFEPPDRPLTQARLEAIEASGGNPFMEDSLPRAILRFKQGFGRLVRSKTDRGRVVALDPRILTARYGKQFLDALPPGVRIIRSGEPETPPF